MKKILIVSFPWTDNYGGILQIYALSRVLEKKGFHVDVLNCYDKKKIQAGYTRKQLLIHSSWNLIKGPLGGWARHHKTNRFRKAFLSLTRKYSDSDQLKGRFEDYDYVIVGSDQVWNMAISNDPDMFFLKFAEAPHKVSYAASFGKDYCDEKYYGLIEKEVGGFSGVSVRDSFSRSILHKICNADCCITLDPTLLLNKTEWDRIIKQKRKHGKKYILCYYMPTSNTKVIDAIRKIGWDLASEFDCSVVNIGKKEYEVLKFWQKNNTWSGPLEFLNLLQGAEYVVTNSFHGTIFSINFQKEFFACVDSSVDTRENLAGRIEDVLTRVGLRDRMIDCSTEPAKAHCEKIDYSKVQPKLAMHVKESEGFIDRALT